MLLCGAEGQLVVGEGVVRVEGVQVDELRPVEERERGESKIIIVIFGMEKPHTGLEVEVKLAKVSAKFYSVLALSR